jgi:hypothetical protein
MVDGLSTMYSLKVSCGGAHTMVICRPRRSDEHVAAAPPKLKPIRRSLSLNSSEYKYKGKSSSDVFTSGGGSVPPPPSHPPTASIEEDTNNEDDEDGSSTAVDQHVPICTDPPRASMVGEDDTIKQIFSYCRHNRIKEVQEALDGGFNIHTQDKNGNTLLLIAAQNGLKSMAHQLLKGGADIKVIHLGIVQRSLFFLLNKSI